MSTNAGSYGDPSTRTRILTTTWELLRERGSGLKLAEVATRASVSRQAVYLHFGDRNGLLLALVQHMDDTLALGESLAEAFAAPTGPELIERVMRVNTEFWTAVQPVAQVLQAAQDDDDALGTAWRDRMTVRQGVFTTMVTILDERGELAGHWTIQDAAAMVYALAHFDSWRELTDRLGWTDDHYVDGTSRMLRLSLLNR